MSRQRFGAWGVDLDDATFANAIAELGTRGRLATDGELTTLVWFWPFPSIAAAHRADADLRSRAEVWQRRIADFDRVRLVIRRGEDQEPFDPTWLVRVLSAADRVSSVHFLASARTRARAWDWPLDVGVLEDEPGNELLEALGQGDSDRFVRVGLARNSVAPLDLLLVPSPLPAALASLLNSPRLPPVHTVLALHGPGFVDDPLPLLEALRVTLGAVAAGACDVPLAAVHDWLGRLVRELSHDLALDEALLAVTPPDREPPILLADWHGLAAARASEVVKTFMRRAVAANGGGEIRELVPHRMLDELTLDIRESVHNAAPVIEANSRALNWGRESNGATDLEEVAARVGTKLDRRPDERRVQARVWVLDDAGKTQLEDAPLVADRTHELEVFIGARDLAFVAAPMVFPDDELPRGVDGHELTVIFVAPGLLAEPQSARLWLPEFGDSKHCSFHFRALADAGELDGRVTILYANRILQTLRIRASIGDHEPRRSLQVGLETVLQTRLDRVAAGPGFDASFLFNDSLGVNGLTTFSGARSAYLRLKSIEGHVKRLRNELEEITDRPADFASTTSEATRELLVTLARSGVEFRTALAELPGLAQVLPSAGAGARRPLRLQVLSLHPDDLVPLEYCYDGKLPKPTAQLCANWKSALAEGACGQGCRPDAQTVCPLAFWGLYHVIERRIWHADDASVLESRGAEFAVGAEAPGERGAVTALHNVLFASASKAAVADEGQFDSTIQQLISTANAREVKVEVVDKWSDWAERVGRSHPEVLLIIGHTDEELGALTLQIGKDSLAAVEIEQEHVRTPEPTAGTPGPIVLLFACRSVLENLPFSSFVAAFRRRKASVIIGTVSTVRGRHMAPAAKVAMDVLLGSVGAPRSTMGEILVRIRRELLRNDLPVGLAFVGYGDVDWQIGAQQ